MPQIFSAEKVAAEAGVPSERVDWLTDIGVLKPPEPGAFRFSDIFRVKMIEALLKAGFTSQQIELAIAEGHFRLDWMDEFYPDEPGPRSERTFAEFSQVAGPRAGLLPTIYEVLGLPKPDPSSPILVHEEELLRRFLEEWRLTQDDETLIRAARLLAEGTRVTALGWAELLVERVAGPARERFLRGEIERFPRDVTLAFATLADLAPRLMEWLTLRYLEQRSVQGIVESFEQFLASRDVVHPGPAAPPAVVFVDLSGYTRLTEERGDEVAVRLAATLQGEAAAAATTNGGRLVKLLGDGAMLSFPDAERALAAALDLVRALSVEGSLSAHAGVHAGPVVERDLDLFGRTVNLASRIAEVAGPGEVLVSEAVVEAVDDPAWRFERADAAVLKGITDPVVLFRVRDRG
ncbi:MAG: adenylate/guanylate cyclase domain-containing protein [Actinomycetota bacterium]